MVETYTAYFVKDSHEDGQQVRTKHVTHLIINKMHYAASWYWSIVKKTRLVFNFL